MHDRSEQTVIFPPRTRQRMNETSWSLVNPAGLGAAAGDALQLLMDAEIDMANYHHFIQDNMRTLIKAGRYIGNTMFYIPLRGAVEWQSGERRWRIEPGQAIFVGAREPHGARSLEPHFEVFSIHANIRIGASLPNQPIFTEMVQQIPHPDYWHEQMEVLVSLKADKHFASRQSEMLRQFLIDIALHGAELGPHKRHIDPRIEQAMKLIREHVASPTVLREAGRAVKLGSSQLRLLFRQELGVSPKHYHRDVRLHEVVRLLEVQELSIKEIAARLGYTDTQHLTKDFKAVYGTAPDRYRKA